MLNVEEHELEMVETITKEALGEPPMLFDGNGLVLMQPLAETAKNPGVNSFRLN